MSDAQPPNSCLSPRRAPSGARALSCCWYLEKVHSMDSELSSTSTNISMDVVANALSTVAENRIATTEFAPIMPSTPQRTHSAVKSNVYHLLRIDTDVPWKSPDVMTPRAHRVPTLHRAAFE